jgi:uncharacterized peroxidase-related enzyme
MSNYDLQLHDENTAPAEAQTTLIQVREKYGFIPNLHAIMAESPALLRAYAAVSQIFEETSFSDTEKQLILLTISYENGCNYCMAAHSSVANMKKVPDEIVDALRTSTPLLNGRLEILRQFVISVIQDRGHVSETKVNTFLNAGYTRAHMLDVIVGVGMKTMSNYINHIADTPLDVAFQPQEWKKAG